MACLRTISDSCGFDLLSKATISIFRPPSTPPRALTMSALVWNILSRSSPCRANGPLIGPRRASFTVSAAVALPRWKARIALAATLQNRRGVILCPAPCPPRRLCPHKVLSSTPRVPGIPSGSGPAAVRDPWHKPRAPARRRYRDRKSTRLNSSHQIISYAVFCLKKKKHTQKVAFADGANPQDHRKSCTFYSQISNDNPLLFNTYNEIQSVSNIIATVYESLLHPL